MTTQQSHRIDTPPIIFSSKGISRYQKQQIKITIAATAGIIVGLALVVYGFLSGCTSIVPDVPSRPKSAVFIGWALSTESTEHVANSAINSENMIDFFPPPSIGNKSVVEGGDIIIASDSMATGWMASRQKMKLRDAVFTANIVTTSWDCAIGISSTLNQFSTSGVFNERNRLRLCFYGQPRTIQVEWRSNGVLEYHKIGAVIVEPFAIVFWFENDSVFIRNGISNIVHKEKFALTGYTLDDSFYVDLEAHKTPTGGRMIVDNVLVKINIDHDPPPPPVVHPTKGPQIYWNANTETDLDGYVIHYGRSSRGYDRFVDVGNVTSHVLTELDPETKYFVALTAYDFSANASDFSNEISFDTGRLDTNVVIVPMQRVAAIVDVRKDFVATNGGTFDSLGVIFGAGLDSIHVEYFPSFVVDDGGRFQVEVSSFRDDGTTAVGDTLWLFAAQFVTTADSSIAGEWLVLNKKFLF